MSGNVPEKLHVGLPMATLPAITAQAIEDAKTALINGLNVPGLSEQQELTAHYYEECFVGGSYREIFADAAVFIVAHGHETLLKLLYVEELRAITYYVPRPSYETGLTACYWGNTGASKYYLRVKFYA